MATRKFGKAEVEVSINDRVRSGLKAIEGRLKSFGAGISKIGAAVSGVGLAGAGSLGMAAKQFASFGDDIEKMAARTGIAAETLSALGFAAGQSGASLEAVEKGVRRMQQTITDAADGTESQVEALNALGLSVDQLAGKSPEQQFELFADAISRIEDPTERAARAIDVFGRSGTELLPLLSGGADGVRELRNEAARLGHVMTTEDAAAAAKLTDALGRIGASMKGVVLQIGAALAPALTDIADKFSKVVSLVVQFIRNNRGVVVVIGGVVAGLTILGGSLLTAGGIVAGLGFALSTLAAIFSPLGLAIGGAALGVGLLAAWFLRAAAESGVLARAGEHLKDLFGILGPIIKKTMRGISDALTGNQIQLAGRILWAGLETAFYRGADKALQAVKDLAWDTAEILGEMFLKLANPLSWGRDASQIVSTDSKAGGWAARGDSAEARLNQLLEEARQAAQAAKAEGPALADRVPRFGGSPFGGGGPGAMRDNKQLGMIAQNTQRQIRLQERMLRERLGFR